jgi:N6-L-threonylcarbamoyladenine synthase
MNNNALTVLGIETSCDETSAAVYNTHSGLLSHTLFSQIALHRLSGGVIPEIASRSQLEKIVPIVDQALKKADKTIADIDVIAVTSTPGLPGSLLVGINFAKTIAWACNKQLIGVNHLEGHVFSAFLEHPTIPFPHVCLTASGGHTALYLVEGFGKFTLLGQTLDDAAGEAFDKIAKILGLEYPGGPVIEKRAALVDNQDFFQYPRGAANTGDFSFSGLKTAIVYDLVARGMYDLKAKKLTTQDDNVKNQVASSLLTCIGDIFLRKLAYARSQYPNIRAITFVGGVACNRYLKQLVGSWASNNQLQFFTPSGQFCTDNGAMIAFVGHYKAQQGHSASLELDVFEES